MARKKRGLGRGLDALLGPTLPGGDASWVPAQVPVDEIVAGPYQPRTQMDEGALYELAESIRAQGIMQPILVRPIANRAESGTDPAGPRYEIIAGERRFRAAQIAGLDDVPVLVRDVSDQAAAAMALIENIQRENLNPLEEARGIKRLTDEFELTHEQAAQAVGRSRSAASNLLRLLQLTDPVQTMLMAGDIEMGHARALLALQGAEQISAAMHVVARRLNVRQTEALARRRLAGPKDAAPRQQAKSADVQRLERELSDQLAASVELRLRRSRGRGRARRQPGELVVHFGSLDELDGILERIGVR